MIKNIFLPEKIGTNYLFAKRIVGIDIGKTHVTASQIYISGTSKTLEKCLEEQLDATIQNYEERVSKALQSIASKLDKYDEVHSVLSSSLIVFKELTLPFTNYEKIKMVINFEVEPLLPFSLNDAVIDFIITKQENQSSQILVAAVQKQHITQHLQLFAESTIDPTIISVDLFDLYSLYKQIPSYAQRTGGIVLIDLGLHSTRMAYIQNGQLKLIRTLPKGVSTIAKAVAQQLKITPAQAMDHIMRFGLEEADWPEYTKAVIDASTKFWKSIGLTLTSFTIKSDPNQKITTFIALGGGSHLKGLPDFVKTILNIPFELFSTEAIHKIISVKRKNTILPACIISLASCIPYPLTDKFNLRGDEFSISDTKLFYKQIITTIFLSLFLIGILFTYSYMQINALQAELTTSEQEAIQALTDRFKDLEGTTDLEETLDEAQREVEKEEKTWFAFSGPARASFLKYLLELTSLIDKQTLGFSIQKIIITEGTMRLIAEVKDFKALKQLEKELRQSTLFKKVEPQNDIKFDMKITLAQNGKESQ